MSRRSSPSPRRTLVLALAAWLAIAVVVCLLVIASGWEPRVDYILALGGLAAVGTVALRRLGSSVAEAIWPSPFPPTAVEPGVDPRTSSLESMLRRSAEDHTMFERRLRPLLGDIAGHRLSRRHGVDLATQPDEARRLLGDDAWALVTEPATQPVAPNRIARTIAAIEQL